MARLRPTLVRIDSEKKNFLGRMLIFCEGKTEENYLNYFAEIINKNDNKYSHIKIEIENAEGNSRSVLNHAESFLKEDNNAADYMTYEKYLIFDCDDPKGEGEINKVIHDMLNARAEDPYILLPTSYMFETWLVMHFFDVKEPYGRKALLDTLDDYISSDKYHKNSEGHIRKIINDGSPISHAIKNAKELVEKYKGEGLNYKTDIDKMNPFTLVHTLIENLMDEIK